jgi:hypothetical protein
VYSKTASHSVALRCVALSPSLALVGPQRQPEHVRDHLARDALRLELTRQLDEHLVGDVGERRSNAGRGRELCDQHRGLPNDALDQKPCMHVLESARVAASPAVVRAPFLNLGHGSLREH